MRRAARGLGRGRIRVLGGVGGLLACGAAGVAVAASPKPADAPLKPPVDPATALGGGAKASAQSTSGLVIPATPVCAGGSPALSTSLLPVATQLRAATTPAQRQAILQTLTPDQRQQVTAYLRGLTRAAGQANGSARCVPASAAASPTGAASPAPMIQPDVVDGGSTPAPLTNSYVS